MNVQEKVIAILEEELGLPKGEVLLESTKESLGMDSLDEIETIMVLEEEFDIEINDYQAGKFNTVQDFVDFIRVNQLHNTMSKEVFSGVNKGKSIHDVATETSHPLSYTYEQLKGKDLVAHKDGYMDNDKSLFCKKGNTYKIDTLSEEELSFIDESGENHYWDLYDIGEYFYPVEKLKDDLYNPVKDISYKKYLRCTDRLPAKIFNSDQGCLWMYLSNCGKYYYWCDYNSKNEAIYRRGKVNWVESNYEEYNVEDNDIVEINDYGVVEDVPVVEQGILISTNNDFVVKGCRVKNSTQLKTEWTDKHYDFNYTLTEDDIEKGVIKIDPYFVNRMWRINSWDDTGTAFHCIKNFARISNAKNPLERDLRSQYKQIKRLCELHGVDLDG